MKLLNILIFKFSCASCVTFALLLLLFFLSLLFFFLSFFLFFSFLSFCSMPKANSSQLKPSVSTMARAYAFGWAITTVPGLLSISIKALAARNKQSAIQKAILVSIPLILKRSLTSNGFPLLLAMSLGGQRILRLLYERYTTHQKKLSHKAAIFASSLFSIWTVRLIYPTIKTLDLTFFVLVRALDVFSHRIYASAKVRQRVPEWILEYSNVMVFMMASTEIIFSWFYEPQRLPK